MSAEHDEATLIEAVAGAFRPTSREGVRFLPAWHDLDAEGRARAFEATVTLRALEAALDPEGLSGTARAVLARIQRAAR